MITRLDPAYLVRYNKGIYELNLQVKEKAYGKQKRGIR